MTNTDRVKYLRIALVVFGLIFLIGIYPLTIIWPSGWSWHTGQSDYLQMILGIYATLGVFLLMASRDPLVHRSREEDRPTERNSIRGSLGWCRREDRHRKRR